MADCAWMAVTGRQDHSDYARLTRTDDNLARPNLVLIWFCRCWAAPPPGKPNRPAFSLGKTSPGLTGALN